MPSVDIARQTAQAGAALVSVRLDQMILNLAKGVAWGQYELDKVGIDVTRMMGVPGTVQIDEENLSMLEAGFLPTFYHFVDSILELKLNVKIREEQNSHSSYKNTKEASVEVEAGMEMSAKGKANLGIASMEASVKAHYNVKTNAAYSNTVDAGYSQQFSQELDASSLMRTKLVPKPPPDVLVERIRILLERLRREALEEVQSEEEEDVPLSERLENILMKKIEDRLLGAPIFVDEQAGENTEGDGGGTNTGSGAGT